MKRNADTIIAHVEDLTRRDIKAVYLKQLQGRLSDTFLAVSSQLAFMSLSFESCCTTPIRSGIYRQYAELADTALP